MTVLQYFVFDQEALLSALNGTGGMLRHRAPCRCIGSSEKEAGLFLSNLFALIILSSIVFLFSSSFPLGLPKDQAESGFCPWALFRLLCVPSTVPWSSTFDRQVAMGMRPAFFNECHRWVKCFFFLLLIFSRLLLAFSHI